MKIGFIGCGNMATAIVKGLLSGGFDKENINTYDIFAPAAQKIKTDCGVNTLESACEVVEKSDVVIYAVKPNILSEVLTQTDEALLSKNTLIISIAAGKTIDFIRSSLSHNNRIIRVMPNINAAVGEAISAYTANSDANDNDKKITEQIFSCTGKVICLEESYFPLFGVIGGCGPAFAYMFIDAMARAGVKNGMKKDTALTVAAQTVLGSAKMILETNEHPWQLIDKVCSPGGTTIEAVTSLQSDGFESAIHNAVDKAVNKDSKL